MESRRGLRREQIEIVERGDHFAARDQLLEVAAIPQRAIIDETQPEMFSGAFKRAGTECRQHHSHLSSISCASAAGRGADVPLEPLEPVVGKSITRTISRPPRRVHFAMRTNRDRVTLNPATAIAQVFD